LQEKPADPKDTTHKSPRLTENLGYKGFQQSGRVADMEADSIQSKVKALNVSRRLLLSGKSAEDAA